MGRRSPLFTPTTCRTRSTSSTTWRCATATSASSQRWLGERGLSSLGRCEPHVLATVESVRAALEGAAPHLGPATLSFEEGRAALDHNTDALFGPRPPGRVPRIMVTLPTEAADDYLLVRHLVARGMDVARINGAHDDPTDGNAWLATCARPPTRSTDPAGCRWTFPGPRCGPGPSARRTTGREASTPARPAGRADRHRRRHARGRPSPIQTTPLERCPWTRRGSNAATRETWSSGRHPRLAAASSGWSRPPPRRLRRGGLGHHLSWRPGATLSCEGDVTRVGELPRIPQYHVLGVGDPLVLTRRLDPAAPWRHGQPGYARIGCTLPAAFEAARRRPAGDPRRREDDRRHRQRRRRRTPRPDPDRRRRRARGFGPRRGSTFPTPISPWPP